jgi:hypothetical protein
VAFFALVVFFLAAIFGRTSCALFYPAPCASKPIEGPNSAEFRPLVPFFGL